MGIVLALILAFLPLRSFSAPANATSADPSSHWAFQPRTHPRIPAVKDERWCTTPIDRFVLARLEAEGLAPSPPADDITLLRRVSYDLIGLAPSAPEIDAFLADHSPDRFTRVVERLLASPLYGEKWGRHWLDTVRYADARDLIQLPAESDFREAWRYRDWVVNAFNRDIPHERFVREQLAGDLSPPRRADEPDFDALVATGFLAIADFVPGDVDKDVMIADYVNDQLDVTGRAFLGLTLGCARCHDHKFDPVSIEDYYSLAGIFFSTRLVPSPVLGNTPLVKIPLVPKPELDRIEAARKRVPELERQIERDRNAGDLEFLDRLPTVVAESGSNYIKAVLEFNTGVRAGRGTNGVELAERLRLRPDWLARWIAFLDRGTNGVTDLSPGRGLVHGILDGMPGPDQLAKIDALGTELRAAAVGLAHGASKNDSLATNEIVSLRARERGIGRTRDGRVVDWPNEGRARRDFAGVPDGASGPIVTNVLAGGRPRPVFRFEGQQSMRIPAVAPSHGTLLAVVHPETTGGGERLIGWEDSDAGKHGVGLMVKPGGGLHAVVRKDGASGDIVAEPVAKPGLEIVALSWGPAGVRLHRDGALIGTNNAIDGISSDPAIHALAIGGPGSGGSAKFKGDLAELRVYDRQLSDIERQGLEGELRERWFGTGPAEATPTPVALLMDELVSRRSPFWLDETNRTGAFASKRSEGLRQSIAELAVLRETIKRELPQAVAVRDGGPTGTRFEGFKDAAVFLRGNPKNVGKTVQRGFPKALWHDAAAAVHDGSGRLDLAKWISSPDNPLGSRVAVNRIWQGHFGEGIVRTTSNFGARGDRPSHPELLDYLADCWVKSGGSSKELHRMIVLSSTYRQGSQGTAEAARRDPENRWLGHVNRRRLTAEEIRDALLRVAGRLDLAEGGPGFQDAGVPRRALYLMAVRTGGTAAGFGPLFDRPDGCAVVEKRNASIVAPQALFWMNDPFVKDAASRLADKINKSGVHESDATVNALYRTILGRSATADELTLGRERLQDAGDDALPRYIKILLCTNEFVYVD